MKDFLEKVAALARDGQVFATATVVARQAPVSAHLGDRAIVFADGRMEGFVGGACSREIVRQQAIEALRLRHARLVSIRPDAEAASTDPEHVVVPMTCASEGAVDVYVEPFVPKRRVVVVGATPVADAVARTALSVHYDVVQVVDASELRDIGEAAPSGLTVTTLDSLGIVLGNLPGQTAVVVASQGHYDEEALAVALRSGAEYVGLLASKKRGGTIKSFLEGSGVPNVSALRFPAGLDLGARTAPEVALSILAEIVQLRPSDTLKPVGGAASHDAAIEPAPVPAESPTAIDPVCGMTVQTAGARHTADLDGVTYFFCCPSCRAKFLQEPARFLAARP
jgi:xanthine dehydrogenase accessory factor